MTTLEWIVIGLVVGAVAAATVCSAYILIKALASFMRDD